MRHCSGDPYWTKARFQSKCANKKCDNPVIKKGEDIFYYPRCKSVFCSGCGQAEFDSFQIESAENRISDKNRRRLEQKNAKHDVKPGDLYCCSWGYDQTNVDFYKVKKVKGCYAWLVEIGSKVVPGSSGFDCCQLLPDPDNEKGDLKRKKIITHFYSGKPSTCFKMYSFAHAYKCSEKEEKYCSWYH